jgi:mycofactocin precursor
MSEPAVTPETVDSSELKATTPDPADDLVITDDLLVEDVSIDGMCGVY